MKQESETIKELYTLFEEKKYSLNEKKVFVLLWLEDINFHSEYDTLLKRGFISEVENQDSDVISVKVQKEVSNFSQRTGWGSDLYGEPLIMEIMNHLK